jgi:hypothetical protein
VLGCRIDASVGELHEHYVRLAKRYHPDRHIGASTRAMANATKQMTAINEAWDTLSNPVSRARYDDGLAGAAGVAPGSAGPADASPFVAPRRGVAVSPQRAQEHEAALVRDIRAKLGDGWRLTNAHMLGELIRAGFRPRYQLRCWGRDQWRRLARLDPLDVWGLTVHGADISNDDLALVGPCANLHHLDVSSTAIDDGAARHLQPISMLEDLDLSFTRFGDGGLRHLGALEHLRYLALVDCPITDESAGVLAQLTHLHTLVLRGTSISGAALRHLEPLADLRLLALPRRLWWTWHRELRTRLPAVELLA